MVGFLTDDFMKIWRFHERFHGRLGFHRHFLDISWKFHGGFMEISWKFHGGFMEILLGKISVLHILTHAMDPMAIPAMLGALRVAVCSGTGHL